MPDAAAVLSAEMAGGGRQQQQQQSQQQQHDSHRITLRDIVHRVKFSDSFRNLYNGAIVSACVLVVVAAWSDHMHSSWFLFVEGMLTLLFLGEVMLRIHTAQGLRAYIRHSRVNCVDAVLAVVCAVLFVVNVVVGGSSSAEAEAALIGVRYTRYARYLSQVGRICLFGLLLASSSQKLTEHQQNDLLVEAPGGGRTPSPQLSPSHKVWMQDDDSDTMKVHLDNSPPLAPIGNGRGWPDGYESGGGRKRTSPATKNCSLRLDPAV
eukprot:TRINITY_DN1008_c0_g2_i1.p1 TRINITY_DN1008_c0_g2~~TRINITY_DN1008_c0_g2_i1.p1  ORF type:complete len:297 (+),score=69.87 TRINITY_DN1008_c0_g2_i1:101-892(+)